MLPKVPKVTPPWVKGIARRLGYAYFAYEIVDYIASKGLEYMLEETEDQINEYNEKYGPGPKWPKEIQNDFRKELLVEAIMLRRGYFQEVGIDLSKAGVGFFTRGRAGNLVIGEHEKIRDTWYERDTMYQDGSLEEAFSETNYILNLLGLENFNLDDF